MAAGRSRWSRSSIWATSRRWRPRSRRPWRSGCARWWMRCRATRAGASRSSPSSRGGPASTSSPRPGSTTTATTAHPLEHRITVEELADLFVAGRHRRDRRLRLRRAGRAPDVPPGRGRQGRRQRRRPVGPRSARLRGGGRGASPDRRADPHPLRGGDGALEQVRDLGDLGSTPDTSS